ncbi:ATP-binding cassette domain-containing protein [Collinsella sp. AGMB00827]|uniref:ATP-binding cassette domain-containing protein n=1 Tax=Collinsella ureilytica TaxID=2869515 RepID=A0ABS7MLA0_9ACTN|nr:ATP-binding cassette domain-containing protein [Collinsella urealyticum]MBY4798144.1 ATP-binding cassette domain-containing protein [Collinsella urealyticum]
MESKPEVLSIQNLSFAYDERPLLGGVNLSIYAGELIALVGDNGAGKSTLMKLILGQLKPGTGTITLFGDDAFSNPHFEDIAYVSQDSIRGYRNFPTTIEELIGIHVRYLNAKAQIDELLATVQLSEHKSKRLSELSGGQLQRVGLLLALIKDARLILLDEPTSAIDRTFSAEFYRILRDLAVSGTAIVVITHHLHDARAFVDRVIRLEDGTCHIECATLDDHGTGGAGCHCLHPQPVGRS